MSTTSPALSSRPWAVFGALLVFFATQPAPRAQDAPLPTGRDIIARHVQAMGGEAAYKAINSIRIRGTFDMTAQNVHGGLEILSARPNKVLLRVDLAAVGHTETGYDGKVGWSIDPMSGPTLLTGRQLEEMIDDSWFDSALHASDHVKELTTVSKEQFDQRPAFKVHVVFNSGRDQFEYFDAETGLQIGTEAQRATPLGVMPTTAVLSDYKKFGSLMQPTTLVQRAMGFEQAFHVTSCEYNVVDANAFDPPPQIKALIK